MKNKKLEYRIHHGNREVFDTLMKKYYGALRAFAYCIVADREAAKDIVQDVFFNLWLNRKKIKADTLSNLLYVSTRNGAYNYLRSVKRAGYYLSRIPIAEEPELTAHIAEIEAARQLHQVIGSLPARTAEVMRLTLEGIKQEEIAQQMNLEVSSVKTLKANGIRKLRQMITPIDTNADIQ